MLSKFTYPDTKYANRKNLTTGQINQPVVKKGVF